MFRLTKNPVRTCKPGSFFATRSETCRESRIALVALYNSMNFAEWLRHSKHKRTAAPMPEADRLLYVIQAAGVISRQELGRRIDLPYSLVDELLNALSGSGRITMWPTAGQVMIRVGT